MSKRITPDQPGKRIGAAERAKIDGPPVENTAVLAQLKAWVISHKFSCMDSLKRLLRQPFGSFFTCLVIAVALSLPMGLTLLLKNLNELGGTWQQAAQISVFLDLKATPAEGQSLQKRLLKHPSVAQVEWISQEQALKDFQSFSGLGQALQDLPQNPLPSSLLVTPKQVEKAELNRLAEEIKGLPKVQQVQLDILWVERLVAILQLGERFIFALTVMLIAALLLVVGNTIRLHIENRRIEIEVTKLVGGTD
ncbi:MAG: ABC transporter permease, partial [Gammaproteobacteria bacterium]|nr:ABC transporter permease [Gammaproteobacteria bacterium]